MDTLPCKFELLVGSGDCTGLYTLSRRAIKLQTVFLTEGRPICSPTEVNFKLRYRLLYRQSIPFINIQGAIIRGFKIGVTKWMRQNNVIHDVWQWNYYEHIIRDERELSEMINYIITLIQR